MPAIIHPDRKESQVVPLPEPDAVGDLALKRFAPRLRHAPIFVRLIDRSRHHAVGFGVLGHGLQVLRMQHYRRIPFHPIGMLGKSVAKPRQSTNRSLFPASMAVMQDSLFPWARVKKAQ